MDHCLLSFLQNLLRDTVSLGFHYFTAPYSDISEIDQRLRMALENTHALYDEIRVAMRNVEHGLFIEICDKYFLHYILMRPFVDKEDIIALGPYVTQPISNDVLNKIAVLNHLNHTTIHAISSYLYQYPLFDSNITPISILVDVLHYINPSAASFTMQEVSVLSNDHTDLDYQPIDSYQVCAETMEKRYQTEERLMQFIASGNASNAIAEGRKFFVKPTEPRLEDCLLDMKAQMYCVNTLFRKAAERSAVHPYFLHQISTKYVKQINKCTTREDEIALYEKMIRGYCYLVKNKARVGYSALIRDALNYIEFHIGDPISLSTLSEYFHVSAPYLSRLFKHELEMTPSNYIVARKMSVALQLLSTTSMQIQEIASHIGCYDVNYFTKIFKRHIGCTPSEYRRKLFGK